VDSNIVPSASFHQAKTLKYITSIDTKVNNRKWIIIFSRLGKMIKKISISLLPRFEKRIFNLTSFVLDLNDKRAIKMISRLRKVEELTLTSSGMHKQMTFYQCSSFLRALNQNKTHFKNLEFAFTGFEDSNVYCEMSIFLQKNPDLPISVNFRIKNSRMNIIFPTWVFKKTHVCELNVDYLDPENIKNFENLRELEILQSYSLMNLPRYKPVDLLFFREIKNLSHLASLTLMVDYEER
jgi:hypothetical protein